MNRSTRLGELQLAIMRVLWDRGEATVAQVHEALAGPKKRALTTIATMLTKMEKKGVVLHRTEGQRFVYTPRVSEDEVKRSMVSDLTTQLFAGDTEALVSHLLRSEDIDPGTLTELMRRIDEQERQGDEA